jgi:hypothetical protein
MAFSGGIYPLHIAWRVTDMNEHDEAILKCLNLALVLSLPLPCRPILSFPCYSNPITHPIASTSASEQDIRSYSCLHLARNKPSKNSPARTEKAASSDSNKNTPTLEFLLALQSNRT